jgi:hypothetical protein
MFETNFHSHLLCRSLCFWTNLAKAHANESLICLKSLSQTIQSVLKWLRQFYRSANLLNCQNRFKVLCICSQEFVLADLQISA